MRADIKAFAINAAPRKTVIFALQKSIKHLSLLVAFRQTMFQIKPLLSAKTLCARLRNITETRDNSSTEIIQLRHS